MKIIEAIVKPFKLDEVKDALLENKGEYWPFLELSINLEKGDFASVDSKTMGLTMAQINQAQLNATAYCESLT